MLIYADYAEKSCKHLNATLVSYVNQVDTTHTYANNADISIDHLNAKIVS